MQIGQAHNITPYTLDTATGRVDFAGGGYAFRIAGPGVIMIWNKREKREVPLTLPDLRQLWATFMAAQPPEVMSGLQDSSV